MEEIKQLTTIKELEELEKKANELRREPEKYMASNEIDPVVTSEVELEQYLNLTDEEKQEKYTKEQIDVTDKFIEVVEKNNKQRDELEKQINVKAIEACKAVGEEIINIEKQIEENNKDIAALDEQINELNEQIKLKEQVLEQMEAAGNYEQDEYEKLLNEINDLKNEVSQKEKIKDEKIKANEKYKEQLEELKDKKQQLVDEYKVVEHQVNLDELTVKYEELANKEREKYNEYKELKETEEYKNKDEATLNKANQLAKEVVTATAEKEAALNGLKELRKNINELTGREAPAVLFGIDKEPKEEKDKDTVETEIQEEPEQQVVEETTEPEEKEKTAPKPEGKAKSPKGKEKVNASQGVVNIPSQPEQQEKQEEDKKEIDPKVEFRDLCSKAKKGELKDEDFDKLVAIMKDPTSYDKLGITTLGIFNKSKRIFKALEKHIGNIDGLSAEVKEQFSKELLGNLSGKKLITKIAELDKEGLTEAQQVTFEKVKSTLDRQETLEQAKYVRDKIALEKAQKHWFLSFWYDVESEAERLAEPEKTKKDEKTEKPKAGEIKGLSNLENSEEEKNKFNNSYGATSKEPKTTGTKEH